MSDDVSDISVEHEVVTDDMFDAVKEPEVVQEVHEAPKPVVKGHVGYEEWVKSGKDPEEFKGAKAYEKEGEVYKALIETQRRSKEQETAIAKLFEHNKKVEDFAYKKAIADIKQQQAEAAANFQPEKVSELTDQLIELTEQRAPTQAPAKVPDLPPEMPPPVREFLNANPWYTKPRAEMSSEERVKKAFLDEEDNEIARTYPGIAPAQHMDILKSRLEKTFGGVSKAMTSKVMSTETGAVTSETSSLKSEINKLPKFHRDMLQSMRDKHPKTFTSADAQKYIKQLKDLGEI